MADKREDKGTDEGQEKQKPFIREKIVRQPPSGRQIMRKILMTGACAVVFGTAAAVCFSAVKPIADRAFGLEETEQEPITIARMSRKRSSLYRQSVRRCLRKQSRWRIWCGQRWRSIRILWMI